MYSKLRMQMTEQEERLTSGKKDLEEKVNMALQRCCDGQLHLKIVLENYSLFRQ